MRNLLIALPAAVLLLLPSAAAAQTCTTAGDMEPATRSALTSTAQRYFTMVTQGDVASLRQNSIPGLANSFAGVEAAVTENKSALAGSTPVARPPFELKAEGTEPLQRAEFLCGIFAGNGQTANSTVFIIPNLPPGDYAFVALDASTSKGSYTVSFVLQQEGGAWKMAGFYVKAAQAVGHDGAWYADKAREFKSKGQLRNAWLYASQARELLVPVPFMGTLATDRLYDEFHKPDDFPPTELAAGAKTVRVTSAFPLPLPQELALVVKYETADASNTGQAYKDNVAVIHALMAKYPELRDAFEAVVARAVEPSGRDFGTLLAVKDIK
ncbi:MAG TPA: hypothetical protein VGF06_05575 [Terriglobales bacterium]